MTDISIVCDADVRMFADPVPHLLVEGTTKICRSLTITILWMQLQRAACLVKLLYKLSKLCTASSCYQLLALRYGQVDVCAICEIQTRESESRKSKGRIKHTLPDYYNATYKDDAQMEKTEVNKSGRWKFRTEVLNGQCTYLECRRAQSQPARSRSTHPYSPSSFARHPTATEVKALSPSRYRCECVSNWRRLTNGFSSGYLQGGVILQVAENAKDGGGGFSCSVGSKRPRFSLMSRATLYHASTQLQLLHLFPIGQYYDSDPSLY
jgi:hypothetical protein